MIKDYFAGNYITNISPTKRLKHHLFQMIFRTSRLLVGIVIFQGLELDGETSEFL